MTIPLWMLLGFALWTLFLLFTTIGVYRWTRILTGRVPIREFRADKVEGKDWYKRAMRAHANCVENLPVFGAIVFLLYVTGTGSALVDGLCITVMAARVIQSSIHVSVPQTNTAVSVRFTFFVIQIICVMWLSLIIITANLR
ncbi:MAG: MAPEG family protein [Gammaproteobacteria bacterium]